MAVTEVLNVASNFYTPRTINLDRNIPAAVKRLQMFVSRESRPAGVDYTHPLTGQVIPNVVLALRVTNPDGSYGGGARFMGGDQYRSGKRTSPIAVPAGFNVVYDQDNVPSLVADPSNLADWPLVTQDDYWVGGDVGVSDLPAGTFRFTFEILVGITAGLIVNRHT